MKPGREGLVYGGPDQPITDLVLIATGVGVVPMIQMVNELLPSSSSSVASASGEGKSERTKEDGGQSKEGGGGVVYRCIRVLARAGWGVLMDGVLLLTC